jgi:hypothetical protein
MFRQIKCQAALAVLLVALCLAVVIPATAVAGNAGDARVPPGPVLNGPGTGTTGGGADQSGDPDELGIYRTTHAQPGPTPAKPEPLFIDIDGPTDAASTWLLAVQALILGFRIQGL